MAREGDDASVIARRQGPQIFPLKLMRSIHGPQGAGIVKRAVRELAGGYTPRLTLAADEKKPAKQKTAQEAPLDERPQINEAEERMQETIDFLMEENQKLTDQLASGTAEDPEFTAKTLEELRDENKQLRIENKSLIISRDQFQAENAQLIKQVNYLTKKLKKLSPA